MPGEPVSRNLSNFAYSVFDSSILGQLACPACLGGLCVAEAGLECVACGRKYPIVDGIPVLIADRAETRPE